MDIKDKINELDFNNDNQLINFINTNNSNLYDGKDDEGNTITIGIEKGVGIRLSTYQSNGWIRIVEYTIEKDEYNNEYIERAEMYDK